MLLDACCNKGTKTYFRIIAKGGGGMVKTMQLNK